MAKALEALVGRISKNSGLSGAGRTLGGAAGKLIKPGRVKDLLSGTWLGHAAHPVLTDLPIGSFTSALALDLLGGSDAAAGAQTLVGLGILSAIPTALTGLSDLADVADQLGVGAHAAGAQELSDQRLERHGCAHADQLGRRARMRTSAKSDVSRRTSAQVQPVGVGKLRRIAVRHLEQ